jgi:phosphatidylinositol-3-phosphatase
VLYRVPLIGLLGVAAMAAPAAATPVGDVFVIAMENHNLTQPASYNAIQQIQGNSAAPFLNSLMTPGNPNAQYSSWASNLTNVAPGVHPSEPNYIWENTGTNYNTATNTTITTDADPSAAAKNIFTSSSLTGLLTQKGITWNNYQEDAQYSASPQKSVSGTGGTAPSGTSVTNNPSYGTAQYNYAVKHNPAAFFTDSSGHATLQLSQLQTDLANNTVGQFNWITPNQYNDMHSSLNTDFTYDGVTYAHNTDQEAFALCENFLAQIVPEIEASQAFQNNGVIEIWFDESEGGDTSAYTIPEIIISKAAVGNGYDVTAPLTHSADLLTYEDLAPFFQAGAVPSSVPEPASFAILGAGLIGLGWARRRG